MVKFWGVPGQLPNLGVTVILATCGVATLAAVKLMFPVPVAAERPVLVLLLAHSKVAPAVPPKLMVTLCPGQRVTLDMVLTTGAGVTTTLKF